MKNIKKEISIDEIRQKMLAHPRTPCHIFLKTTVCGEAIFHGAGLVDIPHGPPLDPDHRDRFRTYAVMMIRDGVGQHRPVEQVMMVAGLLIGTLPGVENDITGCMLTLDVRDGEIAISHRFVPVDEVQKQAQQHGVWKTHH